MFAVVRAGLQWVVDAYALGYGSLSHLNTHTAYPTMLPLAAIPFELGLAIPPTTTALLSSVERSRSGTA